MIGMKAGAIVEMRLIHVDNTFMCITNVIFSVYYRITNNIKHFR